MPLLASAGASAQETVAQPPSLQVVTSIRPLALIANDILGARGSAVALIDGGDSPHHYALTPSARLRAARADFLLWVGAGLEVSLTGLFAGREDLITAQSLDDITLLSLDHLHPDLHLWLNTDNARAIAAAVARVASVRDPGNADYYAQRLADFDAEQRANSAAIDRALRAPGAAEPASALGGYAVYHDAYQYFEQQFGLTHALALVHDPERSPSIRELAETRAALALARPVCLLVEPDSDPRLIDTVLNSAQLRRVEVDILGYAVADGEQGYTRLIRGFVDDLTRCMTVAP